MFFFPLWMLNDKQGNETPPFTDIEYFSRSGETYTSRDDEIYIARDSS